MGGGGICGAGWDTSCRARAAEWPGPCCLLVPGSTTIQSSTRKMTPRKRSKASKRWRAPSRRATARHAAAHGDTGIMTRKPASAAVRRGGSFAAADTPFPLPPFPFPFLLTAAACRCWLREEALARSLTSRFGCAPGRRDGRAGGGVGLQSLEADDQALLPPGWLPDMPCAPGHLAPEPFTPRQARRAEHCPAALCSLLAAIAALCGVSQRRWVLWVSITVTEHFVVVNRGSKRK